MSETSPYHIQLVLKDDVYDARGRHVQQQAEHDLDIVTGKVKAAKIFTILRSLPPRDLKRFANESLRDKITHDVYINRFYHNPEYGRYILISRLPGVTDDEGVSAQKAFTDLFNIRENSERQWIFTQDIYYIEKNLTEDQLGQMAEQMLGNPLVHHFEYGVFNGRIEYVPEVRMQTDESVGQVNIFVPDERLIDLSKRLLLALDLKEMQAIRDYFDDDQVQKERAGAGLSRNPTDCEIEILAQTWSEHCKHKEFNALITYKDFETGAEKEIDSLFKTYIKRSTDLIKERLKAQHEDWLLKVFSDNAGVVRIDDKRVFIWKVETHNSPSALDPYGGALTGIVGVNRDPLGTGVGGGRLLFNTDVLCFGPPDYDKPLLPGQLHPRRVMAGVVKGIEDGGNKSGIPTVNGSIIFDDRFAGKPLVFCGTGAVMPAEFDGRPSWEKRIDPGDRIIMAGGRVGKDGIHGATFSSLEIDEHSPRSAVQIGSPITQKNVSDFMQRAAAEGLIKSSTDNGAGGLSSSVGELATIPNGAVVELERVPLKYSGLRPWEIFVSESQERMTIVVEPSKQEKFLELAKAFEVEATDIGYFTDNGKLEVHYKSNVIALLRLDFLHNGVPKKQLEAEWLTPVLNEPQLPSFENWNAILLKLMARFNICSKEAVIRRYDHEVKGKTVVKPLMGASGAAPQDAAVMRLNFETYTGIAIANGIQPRYGDIDAYEMSAGSFDEAVRSIIAVGGCLPGDSNGSNRFWTVNDNFCVPDSVYHPQQNPDGKYKLAQLVHMNEALYDMATFFNIPMTSGKDSMKNDYIRAGTKISAPPTILYSMVAKIEDVRRTVTAEFKHPGDVIYQVGHTFDELGGSEFYSLFNELGAHVPRVRKEIARRLYRKMEEAHRNRWLKSAHDISDGGLAVAVSEATFNEGVGASLQLPQNDLSTEALLFAESHSRFVVSVAPENAKVFESFMGEDAIRLGEVRADGRIRMERSGKVLIDLDREEVLRTWRTGLEV